MTTREHWVLTFVCPDRPGIVHAISGAVVEAGGNITESQQYTSLDTDRFFMRLQIEAAITKADFERQIERIVGDYELEYTLDFVDRPMRTVVLVSKAGHCLNDMLFRQRSGQLPIEIPMVFANHEDLGELAGFYSVPFEAHEIKTGVDKALFEKRLREFIHENDIELIVLARYMQILSPEFCEEFEGRIINIHHSFLPGFKGANPYAQAVSWFAQHRVLLDGHRTIIFR
jgi:formyltetrahydrofolate deformylase